MTRIHRPEWLVVAALLCMVPLTLTDYGAGWDESIHLEFGRRNLRYFASLGRDTAYRDFYNARYYAPLCDLFTAAVSDAVAPGRVVQAKHALIALTGILTVVGTIRFARLFGRPLAPFFAALCLAAFPRFYGEMFANPKDIPFACAYTWALYGVASLLRRGRFSWPDIVRTGLLIGLVLAVRAGGLFVFYSAAMSVGFYVACEHPGLTPDPARRLLTRGAVLKTLAVVGLSWSVMVALWPWAHENLLLNPIRAFLMSRSFDEPYPLLYRGRTLLSTELPWHYLPNYLLITTPLAPLALALVGAAASVRARRGRAGPPRSARDPTPPVADTPRTGRTPLFLFYVLDVWILFPVLYAALKRPNIYDGMRHFLFLAPALAVLAGLGAAEIVAGFPTRARRLVAAGLAAAVLSVAPEMVYLHPYQTTYFNPLAGGLRRAGARYETDYWVTSYKEAMEWVNRQPTGPNGTTVVLVAANEFSRLCADYYRAPHVRMRTIFHRTREPNLPADVDYSIATTRYGFADNFPAAPVAYAIGRHDVPFTIVRRRASPSEARGGT